MACNVDGAYDPPRLPPHLTFIQLGPMATLLNAEVKYFAYITPPPTYLPASSPLAIMYMVVVRDSCVQQMMVESVPR